MTTQRIARVLRTVADAVEGLSDAEFEDYLKALARPQSRARVRPVPRAGGLRRKPLGYKEMTLALDQLSAAASREAGAEVLASLRPTRTELEQMARMRDVHITKEDTVGFIGQRLVEALVGTRLSSEAIRGKTP